MKHRDVDVMPCPTSSQLRKEGRSVETISERMIGVKIVEKSGTNGGMTDATSDGMNDGTSGEMNDVMSDEMTVETIAEKAAGTKGDRENGEMIARSAEKFDWKIDVMIGETIADMSEEMIGHMKEEKREEMTDKETVETQGTNGIRSIGMIDMVVDRRNSAGTTVRSTTGETRKSRVPGTTMWHLMAVTVAVMDIVMGVKSGEMTAEMSDGMTAATTERRSGGTIDDMKRGVMTGEAGQERHGGGE